MTIAVDCGINDQVSSTIDPTIRLAGRKTGRIDEDRHIMCLCHRQDGLEGEGGRPVKATNQADHCSLADCLVQLFIGRNVDDLTAGDAHGLLIREPLIGGDQDLVAQSGRVGQPQHEFGIVSGYAGCRCKRQACGSPCRYHAPFGAGQLGQPLARALGQLIHVHECAGCCVHGRDDFIRRVAGAIDGAHPRALNDGLHA